MAANAPTYEAILDSLRSFKSEHGEEFGLRSLGVFGSVARGDAGTESDIDIAFEATDVRALPTASTDTWAPPPVASTTASTPSPRT